MIGFTIKPQKQKKKVKNQDSSPPKTAPQPIQPKLAGVPIVKQDIIIKGVKYDDNDFPDLSGPVKQQPKQQEQKQKIVVKETQTQNTQTQPKVDNLTKVQKNTDNKLYEQQKKSNEIIQQKVTLYQDESEDIKQSKVSFKQEKITYPETKQIKQLISSNKLPNSFAQKHLSKQITKIEDIEQDDLLLEEDTYVDFGVEERQSDKLFELYNQKLKFKNPKVKELFFLLLNTLKKDMNPLRNNFKVQKNKKIIYNQNEEDYLKSILPLFCNESFANIKSASEDMVFRLRFEQAAVPLRYAFEIDRKETILGKYLVLNGIEGTYDQEGIDESLLWKKIFYTEFLEFKEQFLFVVQIFIPQNYYKQGDLDHVDVLAVLVKSKESKKESLFLPWNERNIKALKIPNISIIENDFFFPKKNYNDLLNGYKQLDYPNFDELYPYQFLGYLNPIYNPTTYLIELNSVLEIAQKPIFQFIKSPSKIIEKTGVSEQALTFGKSIQNTSERFFRNENIKSLFNLSQRNAIINSCDYNQPITLINGPPGTGKTFTSLGIMSIVIEHSELRGQSGIILACAHSNTVINDWVRKIAFKPNNSLFQGNSLFDSQGNFKRCKIIRIGVADKCEPDIYDYCLDIETQRKFFSAKLQQFTKDKMKEIFDELDKDIAKSFTVTHVKKKIQSISQEILELKLQQYYDQDRSRKIEVLRKNRNDLYEIYKLFKRMIDEEIEEYRSIQYQILENTQIFVSTLTSSASSILKGYLTKNNLSINLCIIDEAPQCFEPSTLIPLSCHNIHKLVLIGDCKQLGPIIFDQTNTTNNNYQRSFYERLLDNKIKDFMLNIQYRQLPILSDFTSKFFYENQIQDGPNLKNKSLPQYLKDVIKSNKIFLFFDSQLEGMQSKSKNSFENYLEAQAIVSLLEYLTQRVTKVKEQIISVISPYKAQVKLLKMLIQSQFGVKKCLDFIEVCTVDSFQGKENDIMIISLVRSEGIGFLKDYRRVNVATSRAQYAQYIFGNSNTLLCDPLWKQIHLYLHQTNKIVHFGQSEIDYSSHFYKKNLNT